MTNLTSTYPDVNIYVAKYDPAGALIWARAVEMNLTLDAAADDVAVELGLDDAGNVYLAGEYDAAARLGGGFHVDANGRTFVSAAFVGALDLDPAGPLAPLVSKGARDIVVASFLPMNVFDAAHPRTFHDANGDLLALNLTGPGTAAYTLVGGAGNLANLASLTLADTTLATAVSIIATTFGSGDGASVVQKILTTQTNQHLSTITLDPKITFGDGVADTVVDLRVNGSLKGMKLRELAAGVDPGDSVFGNADDTLAVTVPFLLNSSAIGLITLGGGSTISGTSTHQTHRPETGRHAPNRRHLPAPPRPRHSR